MSEKLDILVIVAHPDDAELGCGGTIAKHVAAGDKVGIIDLTQGELGTRGSIQTRKEEASDAQQILGVTIRENLKIPDGFFQNNKENQLLVIDKIRQYQPDIVIANALEDRHIDHPRGAQLVKDACFLSGLEKIETNYSKWRPKAVYHMIQDRYQQPDFVIDVSNFWEIKMNAILAFKTQFFNSDLNGPKTPISGEDFLSFLEARAREMGRNIGVEYAEGYQTARTIGVDNLKSLL